MTSAVAERTYSFKEAVEYVSRHTRRSIKPRGFRYWIDQGYIPYRQNPGPRGHFFWTKTMLDDIVAWLMLERARSPEKTKRRK